MKVVILLSIDLRMQNTLESKKHLEKEMILPEWLLEDLIENKKNLYMYSENFTRKSER